MEFSSEIALQRAIESTAGDGMGLVAVGGKATDAGQRDKAGGDERRVSGHQRRCLIHSFIYLNIFPVSA